MRSLATLLAATALVASACGVAQTAPATAPRDVSGAPAAAEDSRGPMTEPGPAAATCLTDADCAKHRCNVAFGKCAFPCATDADCVRGASCVKSAVSTCQTRPLGL